MVRSNISHFSAAQVVQLGSFLLLLTALSLHAHYLGIHYINRSLRMLIMQLRSTATLLANPLTSAIPLPCKFTKSKQREYISWNLPHSTTALELRSIYLSFGTFIFRRQSTRVMWLFHNHSSYKDSILACCKHSTDTILLPPMFKIRSFGKDSWITILGIATYEFQSE